MRIIVCIKQVPGASKVEIDETTGVLKRSGVESKMNPYDLYALESALRLKKTLGAEIAVVSMGPPQAEAVIREAFMIGADQGFLFTDPHFAGSDVLATAYTLSQGIRVSGGFDLIICGKQTTDGDTAQVGPALAEYLGIPHVSWVKAISKVGRTAITVEQDLLDYTQVMELPYPCLITVEKGIFQPRLPSYRRKLATADWPVHRLSLAEFTDGDELKYGLNGSPTRVERIFPPQINDDREFWEGNAVALAERIHQMLRTEKYL
jgi:electron transfer flavoprotein beta subunit